MILLVAPLGGNPSGAIIDAGEALERKMIAEGKAIKMPTAPSPLERAVVRPKETR